MIELSFTPADVERLAVALAAPRVEGASCRVADGTSTRGRVLALTLRGVDTGRALLGRDLPRIDVELELSGRRLDDGRLSIAWAVVRVARLPSFLSRMLPLESATRVALSELLRRADLADAVELGTDSLVLDLARVPLGPLGPGWLACESLGLPDGERALGVKLRLAPPPGAGPAGPYAVQP